MANNKTWWGEQFKEALCSFIDTSRLARGSAYKSDLRIVDYVQKENKVNATMKGNINSYFGVDTIPYYKTKITFTSLQNVEQLLHDMENDPLVLAKLASKELPVSISKLLPKSKHDVTTSCSCPDYENPCKHVAGLYLRLAEKIDHDPFLLLTLRCVPQDRLQALMPKITHQRADVFGHSKKPKKPVASNFKGREFWGACQKIKEPEGLSLSTIPCLLIKKAGLNPPFWHKDKPFIDVMEGVYKTIKAQWKLC
jgi:uncharacterized Zn finger protein